MGEPGGHDHEVSDSVQPDSNYFTKLRSAWKMQALQMLSYMIYDISFVSYKTIDVT